MNRAVPEDCFDVVVVGGRCGGTALAAHLARAGRTVVVLEAAPLGTNQPTSTHLIQPPGMDELDLLGIGDQVRDLAPALPAVRMEFDGRVAHFSYGPDRAAHCLRRSALDGRLQHAASEAGATFQGKTRVIDVVRDRHGTVCGVDAESRTGSRHRFSAPLVVGADGRNSTIAKLVGADEYLGYDAPRGCYWAYWRRPAGWDPHVIWNCFDGDHARIVFPTDGELLLIATAPPVEQAQAWRRDHTAAYLADIRSYHSFRSRLDRSKPQTEVRGVVKNRYFFRTSAGPGWALVGDAGHRKDFVVGLGIADALRDGRRLAEAVLEGASCSQSASQRLRPSSRDWAESSTAICRRTTWCRRRGLSGGPFDAPSEVASTHWARCSRSVVGSSVPASR